MVQRGREAAPPIAGLGVCFAKVECVEGDLITPQLYSPVYGGGRGVSRASGASCHSLSLSLASLTCLYFSLPNPNPNAINSSLQGVKRMGDLQVVDSEDGLLARDPLPPLPLPRGVERLADTLATTVRQSGLQLRQSRQLVSQSRQSPSLAGLLSVACEQTRNGPGPFRV